MPGSEKAEIYFIAAMMVLILVVSFASVFFFFRQYRKEMAAKESEKQLKHVSSKVKQNSDLAKEKAETDG